MNYVISFFITLLAGSFASAASFYTPQQALSDATSENLEYVAKFIPKASISGKYPNCVYRNSKVYVISSYCVKAAVPAAKVWILPRNLSQGYIRLYTEIDSNKDVSTATRKEYLNFMFSSSITFTERVFANNMSAAELKKWTDDETDFLNKYCVTADTLKDHPNSTACSNNITNYDANWGKQSFKFWKDSDPNFAKLLRTLKTKVP